MTIKRIKDFDQLPSSGVTSDDILLIMDDPSGSSITKKVLVKDLYTLAQTFVNTSGTINDWNPTYSDVVFVSGQATITGLDASYSGDAVIVSNIGDAENITISHANSGSLEDNRFICPNYTNFTLSAQNNSILIVRDKINDKWRLM
jgi:hypothetical protein